MKWTTPVELKAQVQRWWDRGLLLSALVSGEEFFPRRLTLKVPDSRELSERFAEVCDWITQLSGAADRYRIEWRSINHRILGKNNIPAAIWIDQLTDALELIGKRRVADQFMTLVALTKENRPELLPWLTKRPLNALDLADDWPRLLAVVEWLLQHPRPAIYLRQMDLPGVHTKFLEGHRRVLAEWLDLVLPEESIDQSHSGIGGFCRRYGFLDKPERVRFRVLDQQIRLLPGQAEQDLTLTQAAFAALDLPVTKVFITENEINFLAFPEVAKAMVIFGGGYGFSSLATASWLQSKDIHYWGDIDTHGFAILHQLRGYFPRAQSLLMDRRTLMEHQPVWGSEAQQKIATLPRLHHEERALYQELCTNGFGFQVRLEQEKISFQWLIRRLSH